MEQLAAMRLFQLFKNKLLAIVWPVTCWFGRELSGAAGCYEALPAVKEQTVGHRLACDKTIELWLFHFLD